MRRVFVHVGAPKTGTTGLQELLRVNADTLAEHGCLYHAERFDEHFLAALDLLGKDWGGLEHEARGTWSHLCEVANEWPGDVIISHEILAAATVEQAGRAVADLEGDVHVLLSIRDLSRQIPAEWQELVKHRRTICYADFLADVTSDDPKDEASQWFWTVQDWPAVLARWGAHVPADHVHVVTVPQSGAPPDTLRNRFFDVLRLDRHWLENPADRPNESLGVAEAAVLRELNERFSDASFSFKAYRTLVREFLAHRTLSQRPGKVRLQLPDELHQWAVERSERWRDDVRGRGYQIVGSLEELVPPSPTRDEPFVDPATVSVQERLEVTTDALDALLVEAGLMGLESGRRLERLKRAQQRVRELEAALDETRHELHAKTHPIQRRKEQFVAAADHNRAFAAALRVYRWMFRRGPA